MKKIIISDKIMEVDKVVDKFNDKFFALNKGYIEFSEFFIENK